jgi:hypothetical protein
MCHDHLTSSDMQTEELKPWEVRGEQPGLWSAMVENEIWDVGRISFCPNIPSVSPYTFLGLYTCTVGTSFREIYCDKRHLLWFACPNQYFACPTRPFILAHQHKALFFLRKIPRLKLIALCSIRSFEV